MWYQKSYRQQISNVRSYLTSEAVWRPNWPHKSLEILKGSPKMLINHAKIKVSISPQVHKVRTLLSWRWRKGGRKEEERKRKGALFAYSRPTTFAPLSPSVEERLPLLIGLLAQKQEGGTRTARVALQ